jgi:hypothetical protein
MLLQAGGGVYLHVHLHSRHSYPNSYGNANSFTNRAIYTDSKTSPHSSTTPITLIYEK